MYNNLTHTFFHHARKIIFPRRKLMCLDSLKRGRSLLFCAPKIIKIEWLTRKWRCQTYRERKSLTPFAFFMSSLNFHFRIDFHWFSPESLMFSFGFPKKLIKNWYLCGKVKNTNSSWAFSLPVCLVSPFSRQSLDFNNFRCTEN